MRFCLPLGVPIVTSVETTTRRTIAPVLAPWACLALALGLAGCGPTPIRYTETIGYANATPSGYLGDLQFGGSVSKVTLTLTFDGDVRNLVSFNVAPDHPNLFNHGVGAEMLQGTATVTIRDADTGAILKQGTFLPEAGIFVSVDNGNGGIGFGSGGRLPSDPLFPAQIQVAYPYAIFLVPTVKPTMAADFDSGPRPAISCVGFGHTSTPPPPPGPSNCQPPVVLPTDVGPLLINADVELTTGTFTVQFRPTATKVVPAKPPKT